MSSTVRRAWSGLATIRPARPSDLDQVVQLGEVRRRQYAAYQPVFWRPSADAAVPQQPFLAGLIDDDAASHSWLTAEDH